jgi:hypothetical protein
VSERDPLLGHDADDAPGANSAQQGVKAPSAAPADSMAGLGPLLEEPDEEKVARMVEDLLRQQASGRKRRRTIWQAHKLWFRGIRGVRARPKTEDMSDWQLQVPYGALDMPPVMDRAGELLERVVSHLLVDPPLPKAEPASDSDHDRDAAEVAERILTAESSESGFNLPALLRRAERKAGVYASSFIYAYVDPTGNGWRPMEILAHPQAQTQDDATLDPATGAPAHEGALTLRYVAQGGQLTDDPNAAQRQWLPKLCFDVLTGNHVFFLPEDVTGIADAKGVGILSFMPLAEAKERFPAVQSMGEDQLRELIAWRPEQAKYVDALANRKRSDEAGTNEGDPIPADARICTITVYYRSHAAYPKGAYLVVGGGKSVLHRQPWTAMVETMGANGASKLVEHCLQIPLSQCRQLDDDVDDDPFGTALMAKLGPIDEVRSQIVSAWHEWLDMFLHPNVMLPIGSIVQPGQWAVRDGTPVYFNPQGQPVIEDVPPFPGDGKEFLDRTTEAGNSATGLEETAQGVESPSSTSGIAKQIVVQQAQKNMSTLRANLADCTERLWRITLELMRAFYTIPQKTKYEGEDGSYRLQEWSRADLGSTKDIKIAAGSFTQLDPQQKQATLDSMLMSPVPVIDPQEYRRLAASGVRPVIGFKDDPNLVRIRGQLAEWKDGPPDGWQPPAAPVDALGQPVMDPATGQPAPAAPDPANPFADVRASDEEQDVATVRYQEMRRVLATAAYGKQAPEWRALFDAEYQRMRRRRACRRWPSSSRRSRPRCSRPPSSSRLPPPRPRASTSRRSRPRSTRRSRSRPRNTRPARSRARRRRTRSASRAPRRTRRRWSRCRCRRR